MTSTPILKGQIFGLPLFTAVCLSVQARPATVSLWDYNRLIADNAEMIFNPEQAYLLMPHNPAIQTASDEPDTAHGLSDLPGTAVPAFKMMPADGNGPEADLLLLSEGPLAIRGHHSKKQYRFKRDMPYLLSPFFAEDTGNARKKMKRMAQVFA